VARFKRVLVYKDGAVAKVFSEEALQKRLESGWSVDPPGAAPEPSPTQEEEASQRELDAEEAGEPSLDEE
jgi:hypothetical protein